MRPRSSHQHLDHERSSSHRLGSRRGDVGLVPRHSSKNAPLVVRADGTQLPLTDSSLGAVILRFVAQHLVDLDHVLDESARVLGPRARLIISDTIAPADRVAREWQHSVELRRDPHHQRLFTAGEWQRALQRHGFEVEAANEVPYPQTIGSWADRVGMSPVKRNHFEAEFRSAPDEVAREFTVECERDEVEWTWTQIAIIARRVLP